MFVLNSKENNTVELIINLPEGKTQEEIIEMAGFHISEITDHLMGHHVHINGRCTTSLALWLGHKLAHISKSVSILDPKEKTFVKSVWH